MLDGSAREADGSSHEAWWSRDERDDRSSMVRAKRRDRETGLAVFFLGDRWVVNSCRHPSSAFQPGHRAYAATWSSKLSWFRSAWINSAASVRVRGSCRARWI